MMTPEQAEEWAQALESDEYEQQTDGFLGFNEDGIKYRCCLGVCVEKLDSENVEYDRENYVSHGEELCNGMPTLDFQIKFLEFNDGKTTGMFANLNDIHGISFENIAKVVRHLYIYDRKEV